MFFLNWNVFYIKINLLSLVQWRAYCCTFGSSSFRCLFFWAPLKIICSTFLNIGFLLRSLLVCLFCYCFCLLLSSGGDLNFVCFHWARFQEKNDFGSSLMDLFLNPMPLKIPILCLQEEEMFRPNMFFLLLLPPIIFESGYSLHKVRLGHALVLLVWVTPCVSLEAWVLI